MIVMAKVAGLEERQFAEAVRLYESGLGTSTVAMKLRVKQEHVSKLIKKLGIMRPHKASGNRSYKK